ncbi:MAG: porin [Bacteroidaceae bacterium]|nr:porin [Bacteroidaceae bacterium]
MKKTLLTIVFAVLSLAAHAQDKTTDSTSRPAKWYDKIKLSGYGMLQYQFEDKEDNKHNYFNLRLMRLSLNGKIYDFDWRVQMQGTSAKGPGEPTVMLVDLYSEWVKYDAFRIKVGQFKRPFTFENPLHPITQGWYSYAQVINKLAGFGDRTGEKNSAGRDIGIQIQGDVLKNASGRYLLHYQMGVFNGEGINIWDKDQCKDFIGGLWVMPIEGMRIGVFGWTGTRSGVGRKNRYALSAEYDKHEYTFRAEYIHSQGMGADPALGDKADGWYISGIVPIIKSKLHAKARYQTYRDNKDWNRSRTMYEVGVNYLFNKYMQLNLEYACVNDRTIANPDKHNYKFFDAQFDFRF